MKLALAADHGGFELKEAIKEYLSSRKDLEIFDLGTHTEESVDYPLYGKKVGEMVAAGKADRGIVVCGTGIGISIAANKIKGVRAALVTNTFMAEMSRKHNDANVLALGGRVLSFEEAKPIVDIWLSTDFEGGRHKRRVDLIQNIEKENIKKENGMGNVYVFDHPLIQHKLAILRDKNTSTKDFRELVKEISMLMTFEATRGLPLKNVEIETPMCKAEMCMLEGEDIAIVPILRAGLGMVEGMQALVPNAKVGHIGIYRDPDTHLPIEYYCKLPSDINVRQIFVVDPMLATGGSAAASIDFIKERGGENIIFMCLIAAPEGIKVLQDAHPDVDIFIAAKDSHLNENAYIIPGLGDAGDRLFGTK